MDIATAAGLFLGAALLLISILIAPGSSLAAFVDVPSGLVVVGGAIAACGIAFPLGTLLKTPKVTMKLFFPKVPELKPTIEQLVRFAEVARRDGILALENNIEEVDDPFIKMGIQMAVDGTDGELIEAVLRGEIQAVSSRHKTGKGLMETLGRYAPAFGMIGTLMGLIIMLGNMDDPEAIGPGMAVALITTLYGAIVSNLFCLPFADKLGFYSKREMEVREIVVRGVLSIQEGDNPRVLEQKLTTMLPAAERALAL
ncbi:Chemotaxis protein PomA [Planctomycetes bacterium LzC2]|uniref:Chemotaxis protein PomA n=2 Tax=Alienimonas chondri TaxID=2681879 RepID=A0ABX1VII3_9PLAN|nr:Chemotaxis protein PomA [Alienimonas chondri]